MIDNHCRTTLQWYNFLVAVLFSKQASKSPASKTLATDAKRPSLPNPALAIYSCNYLLIALTLPTRSALAIYLAFDLTNTYLESTTCFP